MPLVLETPNGKADDVSIWKREIDLLYSLVEEEVEGPIVKKIKTEK
jgi:hypothetical protein